MMISLIIHGVIMYLNILDGTWLLDYYSKDELSKKITDYIKLLLKI